MVSLSKLGPHVGEGAGNVAALGAVRYAKYLDCNGVQFAPPGVRCIVRGLYDDEGALIALGYAGGVILARRQLDQAQALGVLGRMWGFEGFNECWADDDAWLALVMAAALGYTDTINAAGKIAIPFSIQVGNGSQAQFAMLAQSFQTLFSRGAHIGYHAYWGPPGPLDNWQSFAGRYQQFAAWLRAAGVTAVQRWALTEGGYETLTQYPGSGPVWDVALPESDKIAANVQAAALFDADPLVSVYTPFTFWHRTPEWKPYDLAVKPNGQPWDAMLQALAGYVAQPGPVNDPPTSAPPPPVTGTLYRVKAGATPFLNLRTGPGSGFQDIGDLYPGTLVTKLAEQVGWFNVRCESAQPGGARQTATGWALAVWLESAG